MLNLVTMHFLYVYMFSEHLAFGLGLRVVLSCVACPSVYDHVCIILMSSPSLSSRLHIDGQHQHGREETAVCM